MEVIKILEKYFKDPIDMPCPYCEAGKEIHNYYMVRFRKVVDKLTVIEDEEINREVSKLIAENLRNYTGVAVARGSKAQLRHTRKQLLELMGE